MKPVAAWPEFGLSRIVALGDDGQLYALSLNALGEPIASWWFKLGPPLPHTQAAVTSNEGKD